MEAAAPPVDMKELVAQVGGYTRKGSKNFSESHPLAFKCLQSLVKANNAIYTAMEEYPLAIYGGVSVVGAAAGCMQGLERGVITSLAGLVGGFVAGLTLVKLANRLIQPRLPLIGEPREHVDRLLKSALVISKQPCFECRRETEQLQDHVLKQYIRYCITQTVLSAPLADRFLYQIRYRGIIVAHLIGTMHITNAAAAQDVTLNNIVRNSCELIVEVAFKEWFLWLITLCIVDRNLSLFARSILLPSVSLGFSTLSCIVRLSAVRYISTNSSKLISSPPAGLACCINATNRDFWKESDSRLVTGTPAL